MTNSRFTNKSSLAKRILMLGFFLLILPLLIYLIFLFYEDITLFTSIPEEAAWKISKEKFFFHLSLLLGLIVILGGAMTFWLTRRMTRPLQTLIRAMARVGEGHLSTRYEKDLLGFEINLLGDQFNQMVTSLLKYIEEIKQEKVAKELILRELKIGHEIQKQIFPKEIPTLSGIEIATSFKPALDVTGDFYDLFVKEGSLVLMLGDASGKGISACLFGLLLRCFLRAEFYADKATLEEIVESSNKLFCKDTRDSGYFSTAWVGTLDLKNRELNYLSCGHLPALLLRKGGQIEELYTENPAFGVVDEMHARAHTRTLEQGDLLLLYSDGVIEAHDAEQKLYGQARLTQALLEVQEESADTIIDHILESVKAFTGKAPQHDDLMLLIVRIADFK